MPYIKIATQSELPAEGEAREFEVAGKTICVANVNGTSSAMDNVCLHMGGPLGQGYTAFRSCHRHAFAAGRQTLRGPHAV